MCLQQKNQHPNTIPLSIEQDIAQTYAYLAGQEVERQRIASELHDRMGSILSMLKLNLAAMESRAVLLGVEGELQPEKANQLVDEACEEVRNISHGLHSELFRNFGLKAQLVDMAECINHAQQLQVELTSYRFEERLDGAIELALYRILQELVTNVLRHAQATKLCIQLNQFNDLFNVLVEDNGIGYKPEASLEHKGLGLQNVKARVQALSGNMHIDAVCGRGTTISIDIPL